MRIRGGLVARVLHEGGRPVVVAAWQRRNGEVALRAAGAVARADLEHAIGRMRFAFALDDDLSDFYARFRSDRLIGPAPGEENQGSGGRARPLTQLVQHG